MLLLLLLLFEELFDELLLLLVLFDELLFSLRGAVEEEKYVRDGVGDEICALRVEIRRDASTCCCRDKSAAELLLLAHGRQINRNTKILQKKKKEIENTYTKIAKKKRSHLQTEK